MVWETEPPGTWHHPTQLPGWGVTWWVNHVWSVGAGEQESCFYLLPFFLAAQGKLFCFTCVQYFSCGCPRKAGFTRFQNLVGAKGNLFLFASQIEWFPRESYLHLLHLQIVVFQCYFLLPLHVADIFKYLKFFLFQIYFLTTWLV